MTTMRNKSNIVFFQILGLGLTFILLFLLLVSVLSNKLSIIFSRLGSKLETICGCPDHFSFLNHPLLFISLIITGVGVITFISYSFYKILKLHLVTKKFINATILKKKPVLSNKLKRVAGTLGIKNRIIEIKSKELLVFCYGFIRPKICISPVFVNRLSEDELRAVLLHEQHHLKSFEPIKLFIVKALTKILFFVPGFDVLTKKYYMYAELAADEWTIAKTNNKSPLANAVYKILGWKEKMVLKSSLAVPHFSNITEERINKIVDDKYVIDFKIFTPKIMAGISLLLFFLISFSLFIYSSNIVIASHENSVCAPGNTSEHPNQSLAQTISSCTADCKHIQSNGETCDMHHNSEYLTCGE